MIIYKKAKQLSDFIELHQKKGQRIGFVPTMGALHNGHITLIQLSKKVNDLSICSIFINPSQFNNSEDFRHYPVTLEKDIEELVKVDCDVLFLPPVHEIYPEGHKQKHYELGKLEFILEGKYRPGHFQGVCQVVDRLLEIVMPHQLFLGQKDFQQCLVIRQLIHLLGKEEIINLNIIDTIREPDGLAMSSRNLRLDAHNRKIAPSLFQELNNIKKNLHHHSLDDLKLNASNSLSQKGFLVDYVEIVHVSDLSTATDLSLPIVALVAASLGNIRLIDNLILN